MTIQNLLELKRETILKRWFDDTIATYPADATRFLERSQDQFRNPVGYTISRSLEQILDELAGDMDAARLSAALDGIVRVRSVQEFQPSEAVAFVYRLRSMVKEQLAAEENALSAPVEWDEFHFRVDRLALLTFDKYMECREKLFEIRTNEAKRQTVRVLERLNRTSDVLGHEGEANN